MKYVVGYASDGFIYYMDNKLYDHKKQAYTRLKKLDEDGKRELKVYLINRFIMDEAAE